MSADLSLSSSKIHKLINLVLGCSSFKYDRLSFQFTAIIKHLKYIEIETMYRCQLKAVTVVAFYLVLQYYSKFGKSTWKLFQNTSSSKKALLKSTKTVGRELVGNFKHALFQSRYAILPNPTFYDMDLNAFDARLSVSSVVNQHSHSFWFAKVFHKRD